jgi:TolC family type I secretion outer membrane protein
MVGISIGSAYAQDSLSIADAISMAIKNAPQMHRAQSQLDAAHARTEQISANNKPQLEALASYTRIDPQPSIGFPINGKTETFQLGPNNAYDAHLQLQQMLFDFGKTSAQTAASEAGEHSAKDNIEGVEYTVAVQTVQYYYGILTVQKTLAIEDDQIGILRGNLDITKKREEQGTATSLDELNVETRIASIQSQEADLQASLQKQQSGMRRLLGLAPGTPILVKKSPPDAAFGATLSELLAKAKTDRAEYILSKDAEDAARLQVESAKHGNDPSLAANITGGVKDGYLPDLQTPYLNWTGSVQFSLPILEGGRTSEKVAEAEANYSAAKEQTSDTWQQIESEVESAQADMDANHTKLGLTKVQIDQAQKALSVADARYKNGAATNLDYLTAQSQLEQAELQEAQTRFNYALSVYNLMKAVGQKLW